VALKAVLRRAGLAVASVLFALMQLTALLLAPWALGRMVSTVSLPRMREHPLRTSLTIAGIGLGTAVVVAVVLVSRSIIVGVTASVDDLAGKADLQVRGGGSGFDEAVLERISAVPGVYRAAPVVQQIVNVRTRDGRRERLLMLGVDMLGTHDSYFRDYESSALEEIRRDPLVFLNSPTNLILSRQLARRLGVRLHHKIAIGGGQGVQQFDVWGFSEDGAAVTRAFGGSLGLMYYQAMQAAFGRGHNIDNVDIAVTPGRDPALVARALREMLGAGFSVERPALRGDRISKMLNTMQTALTMSSVIAMFAAAFLVFNTISISIAQRRRELGILRALGMTRGQLMRLLTLEGMVLGSVGSALGVLGGLGLSQGMMLVTSQAIDEVYLQQAITEVQFDRGIAALGFGLGASFATLAALLAARSVGRIRAVSALAASGSPPASALGRRWWGRGELACVVMIVTTLALLQVPSLGSLPLGALAACLTLLLAGRLAMPWLVRLTHLGVARGLGRTLGVEATLANGNLARDLDRASSTASGLMIGVGLSVGIATFASSFLSSLDTWSAQISPGDLFVTSGARIGFLSSRNTPIVDSFRAELLSLPEIDHVRRVRFMNADFRGFPIKVGTTDMHELIKRSQLTLLEGQLDQVIADMQRGAVIVSENFASRFAIHRGSRVELATLRGTERFVVAGVSVDYSSDAGTVLLDWSTFVAHWADERVDTYEVHVRAGASIDAVRRTITERWGEQHDLFVLTNREFRGELLKAVDNMFSLLNSLELVTLLVAALGIVTSVLANVLDRVREIGILRALGMRRAQIRKVVITEATLLGGVGTVAGLGIGMGLGYIVMRHIVGVQMGWYLPYEFPLRAAITLVAVTIPVSALAGYLPARQAASLAVAEALDYE
jgi:putative ABC transport system permease protein